MDEQKDDDSRNYRVNSFNVQTPRSSKYQPKEDSSLTKKNKNFQQNKNQIDCEKISIYFEKNQQKIKQTIMKLSEGNVDFSNLWELMEQIFSLQNILITWNSENIFLSQTYLDIFDEKVREYARNRSQQDVNILHVEFNVEDIKSFIFFLISRDNLDVDYNPKKQSLKQFLGIDKEKKMEESQENIKNAVDNTIQKYQKLLGNKGITWIQKKILIETIDKLKLQRKQLEKQQTEQNNVNKKTRNQIKSINIENRLETIFNYYCKHSYVTEKYPTFDFIKTETDILTVGKFMIFCKEFGLITPTIKQIDLLEIFKKNSEFSKNMSFSQFKSTLQMISLRMFKNKESINQFYKYLRIQNQLNFRTKLKQLRIPNLSKRNRNSIKHQNAQYEFKYMPHGGKFAEEIKQMIQEKKKVKTEYEKSKTRAHQFDIIDTNKKIRRRILNNKYASTKIDGYSEMHRNKGSRSRQLSNEYDPYRLNNIVENAKRHMKRISTEDIAQLHEQQNQLYNLIQDNQQQQDEYLMQYSRLEVPRSNQISIKMGKKIKEINIYDLDGIKFKNPR